MQDIRAARWVFTINNYTSDDLAKCMAVNEPYFIVFGREVGAQGTPHIQGYIERNDEVRMRRSQLERLLGGRAYLSPARGDTVQATGYCVKDNMWYTNVPLKVDDAVVAKYMSLCLALNNKCTDWMGSCFLEAIYSSQEWFDEWSTPENVAHSYDMHVHACCDKCKCRKDFCPTCHSLSKFPL